MSKNKLHRLHILDTAPQEEKCAALNFFQAMLGGYADPRFFGESSPVTFTFQEGEQGNTDYPEIIQFAGSRVQIVSIPATETQTEMAICYFQ